MRAETLIYPYTKTTQGRDGKMSWIESISKAIEYIEDNIDRDLKIDDIADSVHFSSAYFQKSFSLLCGFPVSEYIRNRRLANAGIELLTTNEAITDIAMKYGYETHDSFTKAFKRFHGATPTEVRKNGKTVRAFAPLKINLLLKGGYIMDYRIEISKAFSVLIKIDRSAGSITYVDDGTLPKLVEFQLGEFFSDEVPDCSLYRTDKGEQGNLNGFERYEISECMWAIFKCKGESKNEARENTWLQIKNEWLPQTNYVLSSSSYIMINYTGGTGYGEIWVPVREKENK